MVPFNSGCLFRNFRNVWPKDNTVQPILSVKKILVKRQYGSTHIVFLEKFNQKTIWFSQYCLYWKFWPKENTFQPRYCLFRKFWWKDTAVQSILSFQNVSSDQQTIQFSTYCIFRKFWSKDNAVESILFFKKISMKRQYGSVH